MFGIQFYPTPKRLVNKMAEKVDWDKVKYVLEPSAGKGDIVQGIADYLIEKKAKQYMKFGYRKEGAYEDAQKELDIGIDCVEIDYNLVSILKDGLNPYIGRKISQVTQADFLYWDTFTRYDLIIMNPPFADGDKHLLKALEMCRTGGQICCILNAETLKNPYSVYRQDLVQRLNALEADIEFLQEEFIESEHKTDVEIALIYVNIPKIEYDYDMFKKMHRAEEYQSKYESMSADYQVATNDMLSNVLARYNDECTLGLSLIDTFERFEGAIPKSERENQLINLSINSSDRNKSVYSKQNAFLRELRAKYWNILFQSDVIAPLLTETTRDYFRQNLESFRAYDFTYSNIKTIQIELNKMMGETMEDAIVEQYRKLTYVHSMDVNNSRHTNIHYYDGWCTNKAYYLNKKVIIPCYDLYDDRYCHTYNVTRASDKLDEIEKILIYLNGKPESDTTIREILTDIHYNKHYDGEKVHAMFFDVEFKKKGTIHLWFTNEKLLKKWNIFAGKKLNFLPNNYGSTSYDDMTEEERKVVDAFEGKRSYEETVQDSGYYLSSVQPLALMMNGA